MSVDPSPNELLVPGTWPLSRRFVRWAPWGAGLLASAVAMCILYLVDTIAVDNVRAEARAELARQVGTVRSAVETAINRRVHLLHGLRAHVSVNPGITAQAFADLAANLLRGIDGIRNVSLLKDNIISDVYPRAGNEHAIGMNVLDHAKQRGAAERAIATRSGWLGGPIELVQGGQAFVYRMPVHVTPPGGEPGQGRYWGMVSLLIDKAVLVEQIAPVVPSDLRIALGCTDAADRRDSVFYGDASLIADDVLAANVDLPTGGAWRLYGARRQGLAIADANASMRRALGLVVAGMIGLLVFACVAAMLRLRVAARSLTVAKTHAQTAQLAAEHASELAHAKVAATARYAARLEAVSDQLAVTNQELEQFAYIVSHDLKAPLRGITGIVRFLREDYELQLGDAGRDYLSRLDGAALRMNGLIHGVLEYSRAGRSLDELEPVAVSELLTEILVDIGADAVQRVRCVGPLPTVSCSPMRLRQVFQNLIGNAIEHGGENELSIAVSCVERAHAYEFSVRDHGVGIAPQYHERIFGVFQSLQVREDPNSSGVGLAIVKKSIESFGGSVWIVSAEGQGSDFRFTIPRETARAQNAHFDSSVPITELGVPT